MFRRCARCCWSASVQVRESYGVVDIAEARFTGAAVVPLTRFHGLLAGYVPVWLLPLISWNQSLRRRNTISCAEPAEAARGTPVAQTYTWPWESRTPRPAYELFLFIQTYIVKTSGEGALYAL